MMAVHISTSRLHAVMQVGPDLLHTFASTCQILCISKVSVKSNFTAHVMLLDQDL